MSRRQPPPAVAGLNAPADKRFRRPDSRPVRRKAVLRLARLWRPAAAVVASLAVVAAASGVLLSAPGLAVDRLLVRGHTRLSAADLERRLEGLRGHNILRVNLEEYRTRVLESPWVERASLCACCPRRLRCAWSSASRPCWPAWGGSSS
jgi:cell division septal protein FtsQ